jgi:hypothetical protein
MSLIKIRAALESALAAMPGIVPASTIATSSGGKPDVFTTTAPHNLAADATRYNVPTVSVTIAGHSDATVNGNYDVVPTGPITFTLQDSVTGAALAGSSAGVGGTVLANLIAWENIAFATTIWFPYQKVNLLVARPLNPTFGGSYSRELGIFQITLVYPLQIGSGDITARAELIRATFFRGSSFSNGGIVVHIDGKPEIMSPTISEESLILPVRVSYWADIFN